jgi:threonine synthase
VASGLLDPFPWDGDAAIIGVRETKGAGVTANDDEIMKAVTDLAALEGVFSEPSGAAGLAGLRKALAEGLIDKNEITVVLVTGSGLKEPDKVLNMNQGANRS